MLFVNRSRSNVVSRNSLKFNAIEEELAKWISAKSIKLKSKEIAQDLNVSGFKGSNSWLRRFLKRSNYCFRRVSSNVVAYLVKHVKIL